MEIRNAVPQKGQNTDQIPVEDHFEREFPLSYGQQALYFIQQLSPESVAHNIVYGVRIHGPFEIALFRQAVQELALRQPVIRTTFTSRNGEYIQQVHKRMVIPVLFDDAADWDRKHLDAVLSQEIFRAFDLEKGPLLRMHLFKQSESAHLLLVSMHHIVTDMWSMALMIDEIAKLYRVAGGEKNVVLRDLRATYADYVEWQQEMLEGPEGERLWNYWRQKLVSPLPDMNLPLDFPRPPAQTDRGAAKAIRLGKDFTEQLRHLARRLGTNLHMLSLAAYEILLHRYTGQDDLLIGYPKFGRQRQMARIMGYFINSIVLRVDFSNDLVFSEFIKYSTEIFNDASKHDAFPYMMLVERLQPAREMSRSPLIQAMFAWQKTTRIVDQDCMTSFVLSEEGEPADVGGLNLEPVALPYRAVPFDFTLMMAEAQDDLGVTIEYNVDLFKGETIERFLDHFKALLQSILLNPEAQISKLNILTEQEQQLMLGWNPPTSEDLCASCIHELFEDQVKTTPQATALVLDTSSLTYQQLNQRANQLARCLRAQGVGVNSVVGLCMRRSIDMIVGLLGILKSGATYLPLDPNYPMERLKYILEDAAVKLLLTQEDIKSQLNEITAPMVCVDADWIEIGQESKEDLLTYITPKDFAYILYTSGSTGKPKGVKVSHQVIASHILDMVEHYELTSQDVALQFASLSFDPSLEQIFTTLIAGARLVLRGEDLWEPLNFHNKVREHGLTVINLTPAYWHQVATAWANTPELAPADQLRLVIIGGDVMKMDTVTLWYQTPMRTVQLLNAYGPTEATITATTYELPQNVEEIRELRRIPIGRCVENRKTYVLDKYGNLQPAGIPGELYLGGRLADGYLNQLELTDERFIADPFSQNGEDRLYKTGDLVRCFPDGNIDFLGRVDSQIKIRGIRVELGEIETILNEQASISEAFIDVQDDSSGEKMLVAYIVPTPGQTLLMDGLRKAIRESLPGYMVPSAFVMMEEFPLNTSGKVNRKALPKPDSISMIAGGTYVEPTTPIEIELSEMWMDVLRIKQVGITDNFFDLGGHSLLATQLVSRIKEAYHIDLPLRAFFDQPSIEGIALKVAQYLAEQEEEEELANLLDELDQLSDAEVEALLE